MTKQFLVQFTFEDDRTRWLTEDPQLCKTLLCLMNSAAETQTQGEVPAVRVFNVDNPNPVVNGTAVIWLKTK